MPKLSIIIPTSNSAGTIERCLKSVFRQTFTDFEIVIQDGQSSDQTVELIEEFGRVHPGIGIELAREPDNGPYDAMNKGMRRANGEWMCFLGSDDELSDPEVLGKMMDCPEATGSDVLYGNVQVVGSAEWAADGTIYDGSFDLAKMLSKNICHQAMFYRSSLVRAVGNFNSRYVVCADWDFNMRCWAKGQFKYVDVIVAKFYAGGISSQGRSDPHFEADVTQNVIRYFNLSPSDPLLVSPQFCGRVFEAAHRSSHLTSRSVLLAIARRLGMIRSVGSC